MARVTSLLVIPCLVGQGLALRSRGVPEPRVVTEAELNHTDWCSFLTEENIPAACALEAPEHWLVQQYIEPNSTGVLELGGRYGTTTCAIAKQLRNSGRNVVVEPDGNVWAALDQNLASHSCLAHVVKGIVGNQNKDGDVHESGYSSHLSALQTDAAVGRRAVAATPWQEVERQFGVKIDTVLIDCEGCVNYFIDENPGLMDQVKLVLMEGDAGKYGSDADPYCADLGDDCVDYNKVIRRFEALGFKLEMEFKETYMTFIHHFALKRA